MIEYIEKAAILSKCDDMWYAADETTQAGVDTINAIDRITDFIEAMPVADVRPIRRGRWSNQMLFDDGFGGKRVGYICSACNKYVPFKGNFCGECGADMR